MGKNVLEDHRRIRLTMAKLRPYLAEDRPCTDKDFAITRWSLARELLPHLAADAVIVGNSKAALARITATQQRYRAHLADWTVARIASDWSGYRIGLTGILDAVEAQMAEEESAAIPLPAANGRYVASLTRTTV